MVRLHLSLEQVSTNQNEHSTMPKVPHGLLYSGPCSNPRCVFQPRPWTVFHPAKNAPGKQVCAASACLFWAGNRDKEKERKQARERYWKKKARRAALVLVEDLCKQQSA